MKKILIIEDEQMLAEMYRDRFSKEGFDVYWVVDAEEGIEKAREIRPDLIILDILLPQASGIDFLERLRSDSEVSSTKVIAYSNYDDAISRERAKKFGAREYLIKTDYTPKEVLGIVKKHLED